MDQMTWALTMCFMIVATAVATIFMSHHRPHIFLWLIMRHPISFQWLPLGYYSIGGTLIIRDVIGKVYPEPWWLSVITSITCSTLSLYFIRLVILRASDLMVNRFQETEPGKCVTCAFFGWGYRNGYGSREEFPLPEHKCPQIGDSGVRKGLEDS